MGQLPGITRADEEKRLKDTMDIAKAKVESVKGQIHALADELHEMLEEFDESDKEMQAMWNNTDARFKEVNRELKRAERARRKPYFGRIDFKDYSIGKEESYYIGRSVIAKDPSKPEVIDWRAPIAGVYYDHSLGDVTYSVKGEGKYRINLFRKRTYEIENDQLKDFYDSDVVANDDLLTKYLAKSKRNVLGEIIATIQSEQNEIIRKKPQHNVIVQGAAGSGKTTVAMHRISYILYNYGEEFTPEDFYVIGSNQVLLNYITGVLPELDVYGVSQMTMEQLFLKLLYEDYDKSFKIKPVVKGVTEPVKGSFGWFKDLELFCEKYEKTQIPMDDVVLEKTGKVLMTKREIEELLRKVRNYSLPDKKDYLAERLTARLENEITGRYYSYTEAEKKELLRKFKVYFGKREWKGSIFELYEEFLAAQRKKGISVSFRQGEFDVYDLAAVAYLYKRIKEEEVIREAAHVVIDEAQDFGMMVYCCLKYCLSKCTYTIMGDVSQNISLEYGLNDWKELEMLMLPGEFDCFELLRKSYRNTVEIAEFATDILYHGSFQVYPVEPIIRHGEPVGKTKCTSEKQMLSHVEETVIKWQEEGMETIAVVCENMEQAQKVQKALSSRIEVIPCDAEQMEFGSGVMVLPLNLTKGLEFDAVLVYDASEENYPTDDGSAKRLYVAATRALHRLEVCYGKSLTGLIKNPVLEERKKQACIEPKRPTFQPLPVEPEKTNEEIYREQALEAEKEMKLRESYGPKRIVVKTNKQKEEATKTQTNQMVQESVGTQKQRKELSIYRQNTSTGDFDHLGQRKKQEKVTEVREFGSMPSDNSLSPVGHSKVDYSIKIVMANKEYVDLYCGVGILRITPVSNRSVEIQYSKEKSFTDRPMNLGSKARFRCKEARDYVEIQLEKMTVRIPRKTGALEFYKSDGKCILKERDREPRQITGEKSYVFFSFDKKEVLVAKGDQGDVLNLGTSAKYISYGEQNKLLRPALASTFGYELEFPEGKKILCCNVAVFGPYVMMEGKKDIDYVITVK